jgi:hypothetical protein
MKTIFELCQPRPDVLGGGIKESDFAADLALVLRGDAPKEYADPATFFANTHPTAGLKNLLGNVCRRLSGAGGEASAIFRLDTQYGGGKTHSLIALAHAAQGAPAVPNIAEFIDPKLLPKGKVHVAAFDGENADPVNGRPMSKDLRAFTPWGELAFAFGGRAGYEKVKASDEERVAPGADTLRELFGGKPTLILLDELSVYLRKVKGRRDAEQLTPFLTALFKAVESAPAAALVFTLAIGKGGKATDAYSEENQWVATRLDEAESVAARKATLLDPTAEHEVAQVLRRRLFQQVDDVVAREVIEAYRKLWHDQASRIPEARLNEDRAQELAEGYPFHPALMSALTDKLSTLQNFQRVRGMLRLLTQTIARIWKQKPPTTHALHVHHLDPSFGPTKNEIVTRLEMGAFDPAIRNDVASSDGALSLAQQLDARDYSGLPPYASFVARTILWNTFAFNEHLKGLTAEELRYACLGPGLDPSFLDDARQKFVTASAYLDDRPGAPLRFLTEANLTMMIRRQETQVEPTEARTQLNDRIRGIFSNTKGAFNVVPFAGGPYDVDDGVGDGRPFLVLLSYDAATVRPDSLRIPDLVEKIFTQTGSQGDFRNCKNNLVFLVADDALRDEMKAKVTRRLALEAMRTPERMSELAEHQQNKVQELYKTSEQQVALAIQQCYRHLFFPTRNERIEGAAIDLGHTAFDVQSASERPGDGQVQVLRALVDNKKLLRGEDAPPNPRYVRDHTILKRGEVTTAGLRAEFRKETRLQIMLGDDNFLKLAREGVLQGDYIYRSGDLIFGQGDPYAEIKIDDQSFVMTMAHAKEKNLWPRAPKSKRPTPYPPTVEAQSLGLADVASTHGADGATLRGPGASGSGLPSTASFQAEAPLKEALTRIWEQARQKKVAKLGSLRLRVFEVADAFKLLSAVASIQGAEKKVSIDAEYETTDGGSLRMEFNGNPQDAGPLKEFLEPQFRAAKERSLNVTHLLVFADGLPVAGDAPEKLAEKLTRFATGAAFVEASAEASK